MRVLFQVFRGSVAGFRSAPRALGEARGAFGLIIPFQIGRPTLFKKWAQAGLVNSLLGVIIIQIGAGVPLAIFLYGAFLRSSPAELEEAAKATVGFQSSFNNDLPVVFGCAVLTVIPPSSSRSSSSAIRASFSRMELTPLLPLDSASLAWSTIWDGCGDEDKWSHSGAAVLPDGRFVFNEPGGQALIVIDEDAGTTDRLSIAVGTAHGIFSHGDDLLIADPGDNASEGQIVRVSVATGRMVRLPAPPGAAGTWRPTSIAIDEHDTLWVADGYGNSLVYGIRESGPPIVLDGTASGIAFDCPHGLLIDDRDSDPRLLIADRGNRRLMVYTLEGNFVREIHHELLTSPSCLARRGDDILVTDLFGALLRVDSDDDVEALIPIAEGQRDEAWPNSLDSGVYARPELQTGLLRSPHGIAVSRKGIVYLTEFLLGGRQIRLEPRPSR